MRDQPTPKEDTVTIAKQRVREAIATYGRPTWIAYTSKADREAIPPAELIELLSEAKRDPATIKQVDKIATIIQYAQDNLFAEVTPKSLAGIGEVSASTARKVMEDRPDLFKPLRRGVWEVRDAEFDRATDRR
jgi:hypothetical protein